IPPVRSRIAPKMRESHFSSGDDSDSVADAMKALETTVPLREVSTSGYDVLFLPGGHGTMYDLPGSDELARTLVEFHESGRVIAAVCHGPAGLLGATCAD